MKNNENKSINKMRINSRLLLFLLRIQNHFNYIVFDLVNTNITNVF